MGGSRSRRCSSSILKSQWVDQDRERFDLGVKIKKGKIEKEAQPEKREVQKGPGCGRTAGRHAPARRATTTAAPRPRTPRLHATASLHHMPSCPGSPLPPCPVCRLLVLPCRLWRSMAVATRAGSSLWWGSCGDRQMVVGECCRSKPTEEQCLNNTRSREAHVAANGAP
jgi:hypothetical protein